jgi:hypothetical protein
MWGPLQLTLTSHREGAEYAFQAGEDAYERLTQQDRVPGGSFDVSTFVALLDSYLARPRYRPRTITAKIADEWRAMFVLGWASQVLQVIDTDRYLELREERR